ncbi:MAG: ABC transporter ATP-binding protein [Phycisphaerales bacterium]|nr:ABC transporter ATP-binding protein [Phycisphaerales bacterium]
MPLIEVQALTKHYGPRRGIDRVSLAIDTGQVFGFLGPNGAGKTTTIRALMGLLRPSAGSARIAGLDCWSQSRRIKEDVGYLPSDVRMPPWLTGETGLSLFGSIRRRDLRAHGRDLAALFDLDLRVPVRRMSRGMRQKLGLVLTLAHRPRAIILDEPTSALDPLMQDRLKGYLRDAARAGRCVFFSSHTIAEVEAICDRVAVIREGRIVANDTIDAIKQAAGHDVVIRWRSAPPRPGDAPAGFELASIDAATWHARWIGDVGPLVAWLAGQEIDDLTIARPDLESLFRGYYAAERDGASNGGAS